MSHDSISNAEVFKTAETTFDEFSQFSRKSETGVRLRVPELLSSEVFGEAMARWRQRWQEADQGERKRSRDALNIFAHTC